MIHKMKSKTRSEAEAVALAVQHHDPQPCLRILVAEDDTLIRQLNTEMLINSGYRVDAAEDGAVAWDALQATRYDLLITDNGMPNVTGVDLLKKVHAARLALPVIMATGELPKKEFTQFPWLQPDAVLLKPYTMPEFLGAVKEVLHAAAGALAGESRRCQPGMASRQQTGHGRLIPKSGPVPG